VILDGLRTWMLAQASIAALVGTKVWTTEAPARSALPHILITKTGGDKYEAMDGTGGHGDLAEAEFDIECKATNPKAAETIANTVSAALKDYTGAMGDVTCAAAHEGDDFQDYEKPIDGNDAGRFVSTLEYTIQFK
jgi:hypothetical protein